MWSNYSDTIRIVSEYFLELSSNTLMVLGISDVFCTSFAKSSKKLHTWLINHKRIGPILRNWESHKVVPKNAKIIMVIMQISAVVIIQYTLNNVLITISLAVLLIFVAWYVIRLPSTV